MVMRPVLEIFAAADDFALRPVGERPSHDRLVLNGELTSAEAGTAVTQIAVCHDFEPEEGHRPCPTGPLGRSLPVLLTMPDLSPPEGSG
ncbi:hypothetical protein [Streptomyces sp. NPDC008125]|uniref:hypothetical protein n=1 Tax=Streptomyces sp. NPDC008125 TaxID=3364811 RepID=UPI0036E709A5